MTKKRSNIFLLFIITAFFVTFCHIKNSAAEEAQSFKNPNAHNCYKEEGKNVWTCEYKGEKFSWETDDEGETDYDEGIFDFGGIYLGTCPVLAVSLEQRTGCSFCPLFLVLYNAIQDISTNSFKALAPYLTSILVIGFAIWIALVTLPIVSALEKQDAIKYLKTILTQSLKVAICVLFLLFPEELYRLLVDTILIAGMDFGASFLFNVDTETIEPLYSIGEIKKGLIGTDVYFALERFIQALEAEIGFLLALGSNISCVGLKSLSFDMLANGLLVYFLSVCLLIAFGFYLADAVIQIGIVGALMPLLLAAYPFKVTSSYATTGIKVLMNSFFIFLIMGVVISINITLILQSLIAGNTEGTADSKMLIFEAFQSNDIDVIAKLFDIGTAGGVGLIACIALAYKFTQQATSIADHYSGGGIVKGSADIAGMGLKGAANIGNRATKPVRKLASDKIKNSKAYKNTKAFGQKLGNAALKYSGAKWAGNQAKKLGQKAENMAVNTAARGLNFGQDVKEGAKDIANQAANTQAGKAIKSGLDKAGNVVGKAREAIGLDSKQSRQRAFNEKVNKEDNEDE